MTIHTSTTHTITLVATRIAILQVGATPSATTLIIIPITPLMLTARTAQSCSIQAQLTMHNTAISIAKIRLRVPYSLNTSLMDHMAFTIIMAATNIMRAIATLIILLLRTSL